jgi:threonyl-tRNA synthetase
MIHCAVMGSLERFMAVLLEHLGGVLPLWLSPVQVNVLPVSEKHAAYAQEVMTTLTSAGIRAEISADDSLGKRIRLIKTEKVPCFLVLGDKEMEANEVTLENRAGDKRTVPLADFVERTAREIMERSNI